MVRVDPIKILNRNLVYDNGVRQEYKCPKCGRIFDDVQDPVAVFDDHYDRYHPFDFRPWAGGD